MLNSLFPGLSEKSGWRRETEEEGAKAFLLEEEQDRWEPNLKFGSLEFMVGLNSL